MKYYIFISKDYDSRMGGGLASQQQRMFSALKSLDSSRSVVIRDEYIYLPQNHYLEPLDTNKAINDYDPKDFTIKRGETVCVVPDLRFLKYIQDYEWVFHNASTGEDINLNSIREPVVAPTKQILLPAGYYDILFRYRLSDDPDNIHEVNLKSAFIQSDEKIA